MKNPNDYADSIPPDFEVISKVVLQCDGKIRFTPVALKLVAPVLGYHGIDVRSIKTIDQYKNACSQILDKVVSHLAGSSDPVEVGLDLKQLIEELMAEPEKNE